LRALYQIELEAGQLDQATQHLFELAKLEDQPNDWQKLIELWLSRRDPEKAISAARSALKTASQGDKAESAHLALVKLLIETGNFEEAEVELSKIKPTLFSKMLTALVAIKKGDRKSAEKALEEGYSYKF
jgi:lipopolysaccharide biosynthesis regulator YciM